MIYWKGFQRPSILEVDGESLTPTYGRFTAQPFERGFATTVGNALRRCLLSSIEGAAVTAVEIDGALHEFSSVPGVLEDVTHLVLNLKRVPLILHSEEPKTIEVNAKGPGPVLASALATDSSVEVVDPDLEIAHLNEDGELNMRVRIARGRGYVSAENNLDDTMGIGWIPVDSVHSPIQKVNYLVEDARVGRSTDYERLSLEVWTNGAIEPREAVSLASNLLQAHLAIFVESAVQVGDAEDETTTADSDLSDLLSRSIDDLDLSSRSANSLKNAQIKTLGDLVARSERQMLETKNFGQKSLEEVQEILEKLGLSFGMASGEVSA